MPFDHEQSKFILSEYFIMYRIRVGRKNFLLECPPPLSFSQKEKEKNIRSKVFNAI